MPSKTPDRSASRMTRDLKHTHDIACKIGQKAAEAARDFYNNRNTLILETKGPHAFVSHADREVEQLIRAELAAVFPEDSILGEEFGRTDENASFWAIDPIDGTANFMRGSPLWGISIAFVEDNQPVVGCIVYPVLETQISAYQKSGLLLNGQPQARDDQFASVPVCAVGENPHWAETELPRVERKLRKSGWGVAGYRCATIGLGFAALGRVDGYVEDKTSIWDHAAGVVIAEEAGLKTQFDMNPDPCSCFVAVGGGKLFELIKR